ncbi:MAG: hypothetical protein JNL97_03895, partial [Verrucomicrobiales bacterium]|nr:hypothetical protein [Verrucomicrobiales bacterium]
MTRSASLGFRLVDPATRRVVPDGWIVEAVPEGSTTRPVYARRNPSGIQVFGRLPGLAAYELGDPDARNADGSARSEVRRTYVVRVRDREDRYLPFRWNVEVPHSGIHGIDPTGFPTFAAALPPELATLGPFVPVFSSPQRTLPAGMAAIRADLAVGDEETPASWAWVRATVSAGANGPRVVVDGVADARGGVLLAFPLPEPEDSLPTSVLDTGAPFGGRGWNVRLQVRYLGVGANSDAPDLNALLAQAEAAPATIADGTASPADRL